MNLRSSAAALLALTLVTAMPARAGAEESAVTTALEPAPLPVLLRPTVPNLTLTGAPSRSLPLAIFAKTPEDVRLSHGAKTALIITAVIVGALLITGAVVLSRPGHF